MSTPAPLHTSRMKSLPTLLIALVVSTPLTAPAADWRALWDGKSMQGWHVIGKGQWKVEENALHATNVKSEKEFGHLVTDRDYTNFTVRLKYKAVKGNSGLYFRIAEKGFSGVTGFQAEIDPDKDAGGLYETNGRSWVSQPKPEDVAKWYKPGVWNEMTVTARGGDIVVTVNGMTSAVLKDDPGRSAGKFALQVHGSQDVDVWFKDIYIQEH
jgi:hypothetical protein